MNRLFTFLLAGLAMAAGASAQGPEGDTAGKVDRAPRLKPIDRSEVPAAQPAPKPMIAVPRPTKPAVLDREKVKPPAIDKAAKPALRRGFLVESKVVNPRVFFPIKGAEKTVLAAAYEWEYGTQTYTTEKWAEIDSKAFAEESIALADELLTAITPRYVKDNRGVIEYAILHDDDPFVSSVLISKKFIEYFEPTLGDHVHAVVIDRKTIYLFPATGHTLTTFAEPLLEQYNDTLEPVSLEIFSITRDGYEVVGQIEP